MEMISGHFLGGLPPGEMPGLFSGLVAAWFQGGVLGVATCFQGGGY